MSTSRDSVILAVRTFLKKYIGDRTLKDDENVFGAGLVNSLFAMQLILFLENSFQIKVGNEDLNIKNFETLDKIAEFVLAKS